jgi:hypothetical protein
MPTALIAGEMSPGQLSSLNSSPQRVASNTCTRSESLLAGASYPAIAVLVNIAANAPSPLINQVTVSGGSSAMAANSDPATITSANACDVGNSGTVNVTDVQLMIDEALGVVPAVNDLSQDGVVNVVDIQIVIAGALGLGCSGS